jgi:hypothetical protein
MGIGTTLLKETTGHANHTISSDANAPFGNSQALISQFGTSQDGRDCGVAIAAFALVEGVDVDAEDLVLS